MAGAKTRSKHSKELNTKYKAQSTYSKNKTRKLKAHLARQPNDEVAKEALKHTSVWRRGTPNKPILTHEMKTFQTMKGFLKSGKALANAAQAADISAAMAKRRYARTLNPVINQVEFKVSHGKLVARI